MIEIKEFLPAKIQELNALLKNENTAGQEKLCDSIDKIRHSPWGEKHFVAGNVAYLPAKGRAIFVGDIHGDLEAVLSVLRQINFIKTVEGGEKDIFLVFLGDYTDRGKKDLATIYEVITLKLKYPNNVILLRGNHESLSVGEAYGLLDSFLKVYGEKDGHDLFVRYIAMTGGMPGLVVTANGIAGVHGGIPNRDIHSLMDLNGKDGDELISQMCWNDPNRYIDERRSSPRGGTAQLFGETAFRKFMAVISAEVMIRSHQVIESGVEALFSRTLFTIFSTGSPRSESSGYSKRVERPVFMLMSLERENIFFLKSDFIEVSY